MHTCGMCHADDALAQGGFQVSKKQIKHAINQDSISCYSYTDVPAALPHEVARPHVELHVWLICNLGSTQFVAVQGLVLHVHKFPSTVVPAPVIWWQL